MDSVYVYIDGYNFYHGINHPGWLKYGWCDFVQLSRRLSDKAFGHLFQVEVVKYYTAPVLLGQENKAGERARQEIWLDAIRVATPTVRVIKGRFQKIGTNPRREKETDVNIAVDMQWDIAKFGRAILISGDSDFIPAIRAVRRAAKPVVVFLPPNQDGYRPPEDCVFRVEQITRDDLAACRLPEMIPQPGKPPIAWSDYLRLRRDAGLSTV
jgi:predicted nuclease of predicted toxin-antitoxin system